MRPVGGGEKAMKMEADLAVREALGSGTWFPGNREQLALTVNGYIDEADVPKISGTIVGAIAPHAGYAYSGGVAGYTFRAARDNALAGHGPETVVVLGLSHGGGFPGVALMDGDAIQTPLGQMPLDKDAGGLLAADSSRIFFNYRPHSGEHSAENEVPFVQASLPDAKLVIGLIGDHDAQTLDELVVALDGLAKEKRILVVASTDLLHDPDYDLVVKTDKATLAKLEVLDHVAVAGSWGYSSQVCCGVGPVLAVMRFAKARGCKRGTILYYRNSGDDFPESRGNWVVGYGAVVFSVSV